MGTEPVVTDVLIGLTDEYLGEIIDEILEQYYSDQELAIDYEELLEYITNELVGKNGITENYERYYRLLKKLVKHRSIAKTLVSYLIYKYLNGREQI